MPNRRRARRPPADPKQRLIAAAFQLAASKGWRQTSLAEIAATAGIPLDETYALFRSKAALLREFRRGIDATVLGQRAPAASDPPRDRLFDVLMRRFEALKPHRAGLRAILRDGWAIPRCCRACRRSSARWAGCGRRPGFPSPAAGAGWPRA